MSVGTFWSNISASIGRPRKHQRANSVPVLTESNFSPWTPRATSVLFDRSRSHIYLYGVPYYQELPQEKMQDFSELAINGEIPKWNNSDLHPLIVLWHIKLTDKGTWTSRIIKQLDMKLKETRTDQQCEKTE